MAITNVLKNMNLFVDGKGFAGKVTELVLPKLTMKTSEYRAGGMDMPVEVDMGMEKMEADFTLNGYDPAVLPLFGISVGVKRQLLTARGSLVDEVTGLQRPIEAILHGAFKEVDMGTWKPGEDATLKISMSVSHYELIHDGIPIYIIDPENMLRLIDGVDMLAITRANLGMM